MRYVGNKTRISKNLLPFILEDSHKYKYYYEPFVGACGMIQALYNQEKANHLVRYGVDACPHITGLWQGLQKGWIPPDEVSESLYTDMQNNLTTGKYNDMELGFVGYGCSFGGKFFGGYARCNDSKGNARNACAESKRNVLKLLIKIKDVKFHNITFDKIDLNMRDTIVYCDPPYDGTGIYYKAKLDMGMFWDTIRTLSKNNKVLVSSYQAPDDFLCVYQKELNVPIDNPKQVKRKANLEKLFVYKG